MQANRYTDYMYGLVRQVVDEIGPRPPCSEQERKLGRALAEEWAPACDRVEVETFTCSPHAFLGFLPVSVLLYLAGVALYWFYPPLSIAVVVLGVSILVLQLNYREFVDPLFPRRQGENIVGLVRPAGDADRRVIVGGHSDSAYEFNLFYYLGNASFGVVLVAIVAILLLLGAGIARTVAYYDGSADATAYAVVGWVIVALSPFVGLLAFLHTYRPVPGAADNMSAVAVVSALGKYLGDAKRNGEWVSRRTEIILLSTSSEEAGLRGAKRYVQRHFDEMQKTPTYGLFLEFLCDERLLTVVSRELFTGAKHDPGLIRIARDAAASRGRPLAAKALPVGASDASAFSRKGIPATMLVGQDPHRLVSNYHTRNDTYDYIRPEALEAALQIVVDVIERIDGMETTPQPS